MQLDTVEKFFKYTGVDAARHILKGGTLRFSAASSFNDPFDNRIDAVFGYDLINTLDLLQNEFREILYAEGDVPEFATGALPQVVRRLRAWIRSLDAKSIAHVRDQDVSGSPGEVWNVERLKSVAAETLDVVRSAFAMDAIFCASLTCDNQLLWSHYADDHKGVVLEFVADKERDSVFRTMTRVHYSSDRPVFFKSPKDFIYKTMFREKRDIISDYVNSVIFTKPIEWAYEREVRTAMPFALRNGILHVYHRFHRSELRSVYFGSQSSETFQFEMASAARSLNPSVKLFKMEMSSSSYDMNAVLLS